MIITRFRNVQAKILSELVRQELTIEDLADLVRSTYAPTKHDLPLLKLATFGEIRKPPNPGQRTEQCSYRWDGNLDLVYGVEVDYDGERVPFATAVAQVNAAGFTALLYTSPSHSPQAPRWRALFPLSRPCLPNERVRFANRANAALEGVIAQESFKLSQAFYFGRATDNPNDFEIELVDGTYIDLVPDAPELAYRPPSAQKRPREAGSIDDLPASTKRAIKSGDPSKFGFGGDRSRLVFKVAADLIRAGWEDERIAELLNNPDYPISAHVRNQSNPPSYALRQARDARARVAEDWERTPGGALVHDSQANVRRALDELNYRFSYDVFTRRELVAVSDDDPKRLDDATVDDLWLAADSEYGLKPTDRFFGKMVRHLARQNSFHPVVDHLASLVWDGIPRIGHEHDLSDHYAPSWLTTYLGAEDTVLNRAIGRLFLTAAVRRIRRPGCKFDQMLIFVDPKQGTGKSTTVRILAGDPSWFTDSLPLHSSEQKVIEQLSGKWFVEFGELQGIRQSDVEELKTFLSRQTDTSRLAYGEFPVDMSRHSVFLGTTNSTEFLRDEQNRRFWPVRTGATNLAAFKRDRDQLIAEAVVLEATDPSDDALLLDESLWPEAASVQIDHRQEDPWVVALANVLGDLDGQVLSEDVWLIIGTPLMQRHQPDAARLGRAMRELGFTRRKMRVGRYVKWCYSRGYDPTHKPPPRIYVTKDPFPPFEVSASYDDPNNNEDRGQSY